MTSQEVMDYQTNLSEHLQLMHEFDYVDHDMPHYHWSAGVRSNKSIRLKATKSDIRALDIIAVCLATGRPGDVVAAAFDKSERVRLILARNRRPTSQDVAATEEFLRAVTSAGHWIELFPFLMKHSKDNMNRRITLLHQSLSAFQKDLIDSAQAGRSEKSLELEFPKSIEYRAEIFNEETQSFQRMLVELIQNCISLSASTFKLDGDSVEQWVSLIEASTILKNSRILDELVNDSNLVHQERKAAAERLKRRLEKVCQYTRLGSLITKVHRLFPDGKVPFCWVDDAIDGSGEGFFEPCTDPMQIVARGLLENQGRKMIPPLEPGIPARVMERFPYLMGNWSKWETIHPCVHAEIRVILHLSTSQQSSSGPKFPDDPDIPQQAVGCSKRSCMCCELWVNAFNRSSPVRWMTSGSHGKPYSNWAFPGYGGWMGTADSAVARGVWTRLQDSLSWLQQGPRRISDGHASSGSENDGSIGEREREPDIREVIELVKRMIDQKNDFPAEDQ